MFKKILKNIPLIGRYFNVYVPPGHYYSPIVDKNSIIHRKDELFDIKNKYINGIDLQEDKQISLLNQLKDLYLTIPFQENKSEKFRYYYENAFYCHSDGIFLHSMMRHFKPKRIIEVGSGFSSALMLDTNELFCENDIDLTFIEPYPDRLNSLLLPKDKERTKVIVKDLQDVPLTIFSALQENDILFIDSTHVSKTGSDVNHIIFNILPSLNKGVLIHFHDIFYPFEYPESWVLGWTGFGWNENYILKSFLMYNDKFEIVIFNTFLEAFHKPWFKENMPICLKNEGGSIWIRKI